MRDPIYEGVTGRPARPEAIALRRWIHEKFLADPETLPGRFRYYEAVSEEVIAKHAVQTMGTSANALKVQVWTALIAMAVDR